MKPLLLAFCLFASQGHADIFGGMVARYMFEGNGNDSSGGGQNLSVVGTVSYGTGRKGGSSGGPFGDTTNFFNITYTGTVLGNDMTVSYWERSVYSGGNTIKQSWSCAVASDSRFGFEKTLRGLYFWRTTAANSLFQPPDNTWGLITWVRTGGTVATLYYNGVLKFVGAVTTGTYVTTNQYCICGSGNVAGRGNDGAIDDLRFYNRALSAGEIQTIYNEGLSQDYWTPWGWLQEMGGVAP